MKNYKLVKIKDGCATFDNNRAARPCRITEPCTKLVRNGLIEFFSYEDAQKIVESASIKGGTVMSRLSGSSLWVPESRMKYLPFFLLMFGMLLMAAYPIAAKETMIGPFRVSAMHFLFPLAFVFTDLTNEIFGYEMAKRVIRTVALILVIISALMQLALFTDFNPEMPGIPIFSSASPSEIATSFNVVYAGVPTYLLIDALCLLTADMLNAYVFARMRAYLMGRALWLRSLISNVFSQVIYTFVFASIVHVYSTMYLHKSTFFSIEGLISSTLAFKTLYFIAALPLMYAIRHYIISQEKKDLHNAHVAALS